MRTTMFLRVFRPAKSTHRRVDRIRLVCLLAPLVAGAIACTPPQSRLEPRLRSDGFPESVGLPAFRPGDQIVRHFAMTLSYDEEHEVAAWVAHDLSRDRLRGGVDRSDDFRPDPAIPTGSATLADYRRSGFDRGHLAPAGDFTWSERAMSESFYLSNVAPQRPSLNRGLWRRLETLVRRRAERDGFLHVVTGPIYLGECARIGPNRVGVPHAFFKVLFDPHPPEVKAIGFIVPHEGYAGSPRDFAVTVRQVESVTGIDFFAALPDDLEEAIETTIEVELWMD